MYEDEDFQELQGLLPPDKVMEKTEGDKPKKCPCVAMAKKSCGDDKACFAKKMAWCKSKGGRGGRGGKGRKGGKICAMVTKEKCGEDKACWKEAMPKCKKMMADPCARKLA